MGNEVGKIIILAGGISSRMRGGGAGGSAIDPALRQEATRKSKAMLSVGEGSRPFLDYLLYNIERAGYGDVIIVTGERDSTIREYYDANEGARQFPRLRVTYALQGIPPGRSKPLGTADALLEGLKRAPEWRGHSFTVCNSDNLYSTRALRLLLDRRERNAMIDYDRSSLLYEPSRIEAFSVISKDEEGYLLDIIEKPTPEEIERAKDPGGRIGVSMNIFKLSYDMIFPILETIPLHPLRQEKELPIAVTMMVQQYPKSLMTIPLAEHVIDLTAPSDIPQVQEYLRRAFTGFSTRHPWEK